MTLPDANLKPVYLPYRIEPEGNVTESIADPPSESIRVPVPVSSG